MLYHGEWEIRKKEKKKKNKEETQYTSLFFKSDEGTDKRKITVRTHVSRLHSGIINIRIKRIMENNQENYGKYH